MDPLYPNGDRDVTEFLEEYYRLTKNYNLTNVEEALIAKNAVIMQAFRLKGGSMGFKGNVISFPQRLDDLCTELPRLPSELKIFTVRSHRRKQNEDDVENFHDFKVRRKHIHEWLLFLKKWSQPYKEVTIVDEKLQPLPEDGSIYRFIENQSKKNEAISRNEDDSKNQ